MLCLKFKKKTKLGFNKVDMGDLHLVLPALNLSTLAAGILIRDHSKTFSFFNFLVDPFFMLKIY